MGKDESEMVALKEEPGYGGTDAEESKIDISDFKPAAPTWVLDGSLVRIVSSLVKILDVSRGVF